MDGSPSPLPTHSHTVVQFQQLVKVEVATISDCKSILTETVVHTASVGKLNPEQPLTRNAHANTLTYRYG